MEDLGKLDVHKLVKGEKALFKILWMLSNKKSYLSGLYLRDFEGTPFFWNCFAHVLAKNLSKYPYFRLYMKNVILLTPGEHALLDHGTEKARKEYTEKYPNADWSKIDNLKEELLSQYKSLFPYSKGGLINYKYTPDEVRDVIVRMNGLFIDELRKNI